MCPQRQWEKLVKGSWVRSMSPFDHKLLDVRMAGSSLEILQVSVEEGEVLWTNELNTIPLLFSDIGNSIILFYNFICRVFLVSHNIFGLGDYCHDIGLFSEQVFSFLLQQCDGSWDHPGDIDGPFSGNHIFYDNLFNAFHIYFLVLSESPSS